MVPPLRRGAGAVSDPSGGGEVSSRPRAMEPGRGPRGAAAAAAGGSEREAPALPGGSEGSSERAPRGEHRAREMPPARGVSGLWGRSSCANPVPRGAGLGAASPGTTTWFPWDTCLVSVRESLRGQL